MFLIIIINNNINFVSNNNIHTIKENNDFNNYAFSNNLLINKIIINNSNLKPEQNYPIYTKKPNDSKEYFRNNYFEFKVDIYLMN